LGSLLASMDVGYKHTLHGLLPFVNSSYAQFQIHTLLARYAALVGPASEGAILI